MAAISVPVVREAFRPSTLQLYLLRGTYALIVVFLVTSIWPGVIHHDKLELMRGVARSLLAAMAPLMLMGLRYPLKMLPALFFELAWKTIWLLFFALTAMDGASSRSRYMGDDQRVRAHLGHLPVHDSLALRL